VRHVEKLSDYCDLFFVSSSEYLEKSPEEIEKIEPFCKQILIRKNSGYDFGCWSHVIRKNYSELCKYEGVLLANDSNWGPLNDFSDTFSKINNLFGEVDFIGLTSSTTPSWHLQSFFIMYSQKVFKSSYFKQHWFNVGIHNSKIDIIMSYEVDWCTRLKRLGFVGTSLYGDSSTANNPTHVDWKTLIKNDYPYLKKELIRENPLRIDLSELPSILSSYEWNWKDCLLDYLKRYGEENSDIAESLRPHESIF
jgi:lipopolysaccharide biosynthesis protein